MKGISYTPKRADGCHGFTLHGLWHNLISDMLRALNRDAQAVIELSGYNNYENFQCYLYVKESTLEKPAT